MFFNEGALKYRHFRAVFARLEADDVVLVTGTSGNVIPVDRYLSGRPGYKIFNALEPAFAPEVFDQNILLPATEAFAAVDLLLRRRLGIATSQR